MRVDRTLRVPLLVLLIGVLIIGASFLVAHWYAWTPVSFPIDLQPGIKQSPPFGVNLTTGYVIEFEVERKLPFDKLACSLGDETAIALKKNCEAVPSLVDFKWSVLSPSGEPVAHGTSATEHGGASSEAYMSRYIGSFRGEAGREYVVQVELLKDASLLTVTNPRINVRAQTLSQKDHYFIGGIGTAIGLVLVAFALLWFAVGYLRYRPKAL
jgi:hypothetical protein